MKSGTTLNLVLGCRSAKMWKFLRLDFEAVLFKFYETGPYVAGPYVAIASSKSIT